MKQSFAKLAIQDRFRAAGFSGSQSDLLAVMFHDFKIARFIEQHWRGTASELPELRSRAANADWANVLEEALTTTEKYSVRRLQAVGFSRLQAEQYMAECRNLRNATFVEEGGVTR